jgi:hypothetical protein
MPRTRIAASKMLLKRVMPQIENVTQIIIMGLNMKEKQVVEGKSLTKLLDYSRNSR